MSHEGRVHLHAPRRARERVEPARAAGRKAQRLARAPHVDRLAARQRTRHVQHSRRMHPQSGLVSDGRACLQRDALLLDSNCRTADDNK